MPPTLSFAQNHGKSPRKAWENGDQFPTNRDFMGFGAESVDSMCNNIYTIRVIAYISNFLYDILILGECTAFKNPRKDHRPIAKTVELM
jgi:hypothetical protein